jgi:hypothetical protein
MDPSKYIIEEIIDDTLIVKHLWLNGEVMKHEEFKVKGHSRIKHGTTTGFLTTEMARKMNRDRKVWECKYKNGKIVI